MRGDLEAGARAGQRCAAAAGDNQTVCLFLDHGACADQRGCHHREAIRFLDAQFVEAAGGGLAVGQRGRDEEGGELVDHAGRDGRIDVDALEGRVAHVQVRDRLAADFAYIELLDLPAHRDEHVDQARAGGIEADIFDHHITARNDQGCNQEEGRRRGIARHLDGLRFQFGSPGDGDDTGAVFFRLHMKIGAEALEHTFGMVAGGNRLDHRGRARRVESGQQDGAFDLRRGHRQRVGDRHGGRGAAHDQRQSPAFAGIEAGAHLRKRGDDAVHRALRERIVTGKAHVDRVCGDKAHEQARGGARVAHVERPARLRQRTYANALHYPFAVADTFDRGAHRAHCGGCCQYVFAFKKAGYPRFADGQGAQHDRAVTDRFVSGDTDAALERTLREKAARTGGKGIGVGHETTTFRAGRKGKFAAAFDSARPLWQGARPDVASTPDFAPVKLVLAALDLEAGPFHQ